MSTPWRSCRSTRSRWATCWSCRWSRSTTGSTSTWAHVNEVVRAVGQAVDRAFDAERVGTVVAGFEVPHTHVHVFPADTMADFDFRDAASDPDADAMDDAADRIRRALQELGHGDFVSES
jgi:histidine triad (HIT) family protein